jgi:hypothetical protein
MLASRVTRSFRGARVEFSGAEGASTLVLSMRQVADLVGYVAMYEFEDLVIESTGARLGKFADIDGLEGSRIIYRIARRVSGSPEVADAVKLARGAIPLDGRYDMLLAVFNHPHELYALNAVRGWRERCRFAACYLCEAWERQLPAYLLELLRHFDHVFVGVLGAVNSVASLTGRPCTYLPMGVDAIRFCPYPDLPARVIDVCGIGRRSPVTHQALLQWAKERQGFYYYDTIYVGGTNVSFRVLNPPEHRMLYSNLLKRSRYFIANRAWADQPAITRGKEEIAARFYEGAAAGCVMVGEPPDSDDFRQQFDWPDAVVRSPFHSPDIGELIAHLDGDRARCGRIRRDGVVNALLKHDWVYRLRRILDIAGLRPPAPMIVRETRLRQLADAVAGADWGA